MKTMKQILSVIGISGLTTLKLVSAPPSVTIQVGGPPPPPPPVIAVPAPAPVITAVPENYVWDGSEYVGIVGTQYYYLDPNGLWVILDPVRLARFHDWERGHPDWHDHAIRNEHYRYYRDRGAGEGHSHDYDRDHDHGH